MKKNTFTVKTDEVLLYLDFLKKGNMDKMNLLISFFEDLREFKRINREIGINNGVDGVFSDIYYYMNYNDYLTLNIYRRYGSLSKIDDKNDLADAKSKIKIIRKMFGGAHYNHFDDFIFKHDEVLRFLMSAHHDINYNSAFREIFTIYHSCIDDESINNIISFLNYVKDNFENREQIKKVLYRISVANICNVEMGSEKFKPEANVKIDFLYKEKPQSGFSTLLPFTNGEISDIDGEGNLYHYYYKNADYLIYLIIDPAFKKDFDLRMNRGFYNEKFNGYKMTDKAEKVNGIFDSVDRTIYVNNLLFDPESLSVTFTLDETLYKILPEIKEKSEYNKKVHDCKKLLNDIDAIKQFKNLNENIAKTTEEYSCVKLVMKDDKK